MEVKERSGRGRPPAPRLRARPAPPEPAPSSGRSRATVDSPARDQPRDEVEGLEPDAVIGGKYRLVRKLDDGGMGSVWVAHNEALDVACALKVIRADLPDELRRARLHERMLQEARAAARINHPAVVRITDHGTTETGAPYLVMALLDGEDLFRALDRRGRIRPKHALRIMLPVAHGLAAAHAAGVVHRDIKPENIFLARQGESIQPTLIDFGVAKVERAVKERLTGVGDMLGSPGYMAPEQARGDDVDEQADIWSFCVVIYEMLTGRLPFQGKNFRALVRSIIEDVPPPITNFGAGDAALWACLERGLRKEPNERWESMRSLGAALAEWALAQGVVEDICGDRLEAQWARQKPRRDPFTSDAPFPTASPSSPEAERADAPGLVDDTLTIPTHRPSWQAVVAALLAIVAIGAGLYQAGRSSAASTTAAALVPGERSGAPSPTGAATASSRPLPAPVAATTASAAPALPSSSPPPATPSPPLTTPPPPRATATAASRPSTTPTASAPAPALTLKAPTFE